MADQALKEKVRNALRGSYFGDPDDAVYVSDSEEADEFIHVVVVSPKFAGKRLAEKTDLILAQLTKLPREDWGKVTLSVGVSPEELKSL
jgi:stress-induced morphogen